MIHAGKFHHIVFFLPAAFFILISVEAAGASKAAHDAPDTVLLIVIDTLRADKLGCYGECETNTPFIDDFSKGSFVFQRAESPSPWTLPGMVGLLTGRYPGSAGSMKPNRVFTYDGPLLPEMFQQLGYKSYGVVANPFMQIERGWGRGFDEYRYVPDNRGVGAKVLDLLKEFTDKANNGKLFLFAHFMDPHTPYGPPRPFGRIFLDTNTSPRSINQSLNAIRTGSLKLDDQDKQDIHALYKGEIAFIDRILEKFFLYLKRLGRYDDACIIITSDHGEEFWEHGQFEHGHSLYQELLHVPLIVRFNDQKRSRGIINTRCNLIDLFPSLSESFDQDSDISELHGTPILFEMKNDFDERFYFFGHLLHGMPKTAVSNGKWKLIDHAVKDYSLFDLEKDPEEKNDLLDQLPDITSKLKNKLVRWRNEVLSNDFKAAPTPVMSNETRKQLQALGYLEPHPDESKGENFVIELIEPPEKSVQINRTEEVLLKIKVERSPAPVRSVWIYVNGFPLWEMNKTAESEKQSPAFRLKLRMPSDFTGEKYTLVITAVDIEGNREQMELELNFFSP